MNPIKQINTVARVLILLGLAGGSAAAGIVPFNSAGLVNYSYSAANNNPLTPDAAVSTNIVVDTYAPFGAPGSSNVTGITTNDANPGTVTWHFQTGPGLMFGPVNLATGTGCEPTGTIVAEYSTDGVNFTQWGSNIGIPDSNLTASGIAWRATNLYVRFTLSGGPGNQVLTWGGGPGERPFVLSGSVFSSSAPLAVSFNSAGPANYSYSASGNNPLGTEANRSSNVVVDTYTPLFSPGSGVTGITTNDTNPGFVFWHFKAGPGLVFGNDVNLNVGSGVAGGGSIAGAYSTDGVTFTPWEVNSGNNDQNFAQASNVAEGATDLYVRFLMNGNGMGSQVLTWGGGVGERAFTLNGSVVNGTVSAFTTWANSFLPGNNVSDPAGDNDNDGLTNQQEFAFGLSPISGSSVNPIVAQLDKTTGQFSYQRRAASGLTYKILTSTTLATGSWTQDVTASQVAGATDGNGNQTVVVTLTGAPLAASKLFVRVAAE